MAAALWNILEPLSIVLIFTAGILINVSPRRQPALETLDLSRSSSYSSATHCGNGPHVSVLRARPNTSSRFLASFPFLIEVIYWLFVYWPYQLARAYSAVSIRDNVFTMEKARVHAVALLGVETRLHIDIELAAQSVLQDHRALLLPLLTAIYKTHILVNVTFLVYCYTYLRNSTFQRMRRSLALDQVIALVILSSYRLMPPRLLPTDYGYIDALHDGPQTFWTKNRFQLTIAAMPSLHFGTAAFVGWVLSKYSPHAVLRIMGPIYATAMLFTILATANHFLLDAIVGACIPIISWRYNEIMLKLLPIEAAFLRMVRLEKPAPTDPRTLAEK